MAVPRIVTAVTNFLAALTNSVRPAIIHEQITLAAGAQKDYDLATILGVDITLYDVKSTMISAKIKDMDSGPTSNFYINSEPLVTTGVNDAGLVRIANAHNATLTVHVTIIKPSKLLP